MKRKTAHIAVTAGLAAAMTLGSMPTAAIADALQGDAAEQGSAAAPATVGDQRTQETATEEAAEDAVETPAVKEEAPEATPADESELSGDAAANAVSSEGQSSEEAPNGDESNAASTVTYADGERDVTWWCNYGAGNYDTIDGKQTLIAASGAVLLPKTVDVANSNGEAWYLADVTWSIEGHEGEDVNSLPAGMYSARGTVEGVDPDAFQPVLPVKILPADEIVDVTVAHYVLPIFVGESVALPDNALCYFADGSKASLPVTFEEPQPGWNKQPGTTVFEGVVTGTSVPVSFSVKVVEAVSASAEPMWTFEGFDFDRAATGYGCTVTTRDENGHLSTVDYFVNWDNIPESGHFDAPGTYTLNGTAKCGDKSFPVAKTVTVYRRPTSAEELNMAYSLDTFVEPGGVLNLVKDMPALEPGTDSGVNRDSPYYWIDWEDVDPSLYAEDKEGTSFQVHGRVYFLPGGDGSDAEKVYLGFGVDCTVDVTTLADDGLPVITTMPGVEPQFPSQVVMKTADGKERLYAVSVTQDMPEDLLNTPGATFTVSALLMPFAWGVTGGGGFTIYGQDITVHVSDGAEGLAEGEALDDLLNLTTAAGMVPVLPDAVPVKLADGTVVPLDVTWDVPSADAFSKASEVVEVRGAVENVANLPATVQSALAETGGTITAKVTVAAKDAEPVVSFIAPQYAFAKTGMGFDVNADAFGHNTVQVSLSDGSTVERAVTWDASGVTFGKPGTYVLTGAVEGYDEPAYLHLTLTGEEVAAPVVESISASVSKTEYKLGEAFDPATLTVTARYTDGTSKRLSADEYTVELPDMSAVGEKTVTVTLKDDASKTAEVRISVVANGDAGTGNEGDETGNGGQAGGNTENGAELSDKNDAKGDGESDGLPQTGDPSVLAAGAAGASGVLALAGAWIARKRRR